MFKNTVNKSEVHRLLWTHELVTLHVVLNIRKILARVPYVDLEAKNLWFD